jgi:hypothetical protein
VQVTGGVVITLVGWRYCFWAAMAPVTAVWLLSFCVLPKDEEMSRAELRRRIATFDKLGTLVFIVFSGSALMVINRGNDLGWGSAPVLGFAAAAAVTLPILVVVERRAGLDEGLLALSVPIIVYIENPYVDKKLQ